MTPIAPPPRTSRRMSRRAPGTPSLSPRAAPGGSRVPFRRSARASFLRAEARERDGCSAPSLPFRTPSRRCERWRTSTSPGQSPASSTPSRTSPPPTSSWTTPWRCSAGSATGRARAAPCTRRRLRTTRATRAWRRRLAADAAFAAREAAQEACDGFNERVREMETAARAGTRVCREREIEAVSDPLVEQLRETRRALLNGGANGGKCDRADAAAAAAALAGEAVSRAKTRFRAPGRLSASSAGSSPRTTSTIQKANDDDRKRTIPRFRSRPGTSSPRRTSPSAPRRLPSWTP